MAALGGYTVTVVKVKDLQTTLQTLDTASKVIQTVIQDATGKMVIVSHN